MSGYTPKRSLFHQFETGDATFELVHTGRDALHPGGIRLTVTEAECTDGFKQAVESQLTPHGCLALGQMLITVGLSAGARSLLCGTVK